MPRAKVKDNCVLGWGVDRTWRDQWGGRMKRKENKIKYSWAMPDTSVISGTGMNKNANAGASPIPE